MRAAWGSLVNRRRRIREQMEAIDRALEQESAVPTCSS